MRFLIVTGMSGAGKSSVLKMLEDAGYFCVDNLPIQLVGKFVRLVFDGQQKKIALGLDIRSGKSIEELDSVLERMKRLGYKFEILFLDCSTEVLVKRYKETRRTHPLANIGRIDKGIEIERTQLDFLRRSADTIIDTSQLLIRELKSKIYEIYVGDLEYNNFYVTILSFGFKYGIPVDSDLVFDVRFLPNPFYEEDLKKKTGRDKEVRDYVMKSQPANEFLDKLEDMLKFLIPHYINEGKNQLVVSIGCTGGRHRSVTMVKKLKERLKDTGYGIKMEHRDIDKDE